MVPLSYDMLDFAAVFNTEECKEGVVATSGESLRIVQPQKFGELLNQQVVDLRYSPRKMVIHEKSHCLIILESDNKVYSESQKKLFIDKYYSSVNAEDLATQVDLITASSGNWAACVRIIEPISRKTVHLYELDNNEHALSMCIVNFEGRDETYLCVGSIKDF